MEVLWWPTSASPVRTATVVLEIDGGAIVVDDALLAFVVDGLADDGTDASCDSLERV